MECEAMIGLINTVQGCLVTVGVLAVILFLGITGMFP